PPLATPQAAVGGEYNAAAAGCGLAADVAAAGRQHVYRDSTAGPVVAEPPPPPSAFMPPLASHRERETSVVSDCSIALYELANSTAGGGNGSGGSFYDGGRMYGSNNDMRGAMAALLRDDPDDVPLTYLSRGGSVTGAMAAAAFGGTGLLYPPSGHPDAAAAAAVASSGEMEATFMRGASAHADLGSSAGFAATGGGPGGQGGPFGGLGRAFPGANGNPIFVPNMTPALNPGSGGHQAMQTRMQLGMRTRARARAKQ
ncbi:hypothetical protein Vretimale_12753, partial [Volvox reticuliferus]